MRQGEAVAPELKGPRRRQVLGLAAKMMFAGGYRVATVENVAAALGESPSDLRPFFPGDDHLRLRAIGHAAELWRKGVRERADAAGRAAIAGKDEPATPEERRAFHGARLASALGDYVSGVEEHWCAMVLYLDCWPGLRQDPGTFGLLSEAYDHFHDLLAELIGAGVSAGVFRPAGADHIATMIPALCDGLLVQKCLDPARIDCAAAAATVAAMVLGYLAPPPAGEGGAGRAGRQECGNGGPDGVTNVGRCL